MKAATPFLLLLLCCAASSSQPLELAFACEVPFAPGTSVRRLEQTRGQVRGDREFSSGHPAMQELNPRVYELRLTYK